jgi:Domain of unknown function (DUF4347)/Domain of unknown function (DUF4082)
MLWTETESVNNNLLESPLNSNLIQSTDPLQEPMLPGKQLTSGQTIAFVDSNVSDAMSVMADLQADIKVLLDPTKDGIAQITETLGQYQNLTGVSIISHGNTAALQLGNSLLDANSFGQYADELARWKSSLTADADILFHGCNIAAGELGQAFVNGIATLTGADVAASTDLTGNAAQGGDWTLEYSTGNIETETPLTDSLMNSYQDLLVSLFTTQTPAITNASDGPGVVGDYELGMEFRSAKAGQVSAIRYYKASNETGTHVGRIWSSTGTLLASATFTNETGSGWQQQTLATPVTIQANTTYVVSVNVNSHYVATNNGLATSITNGDLSSVADGSNGVYNFTPSAFPTQSFQNTNYFRDIVFSATSSPNNNLGTVATNGTAVQNSTLTATVSDADGATGTISYQWQQSNNGGTTWDDIAGATSQTLTLGQSQVNNRVRVRAIYTDSLGNGEDITSTATSLITNVNDTGAVAISGATAQGSTLTANVTDIDGLGNGAIAYQWQQSTNNNWTSISGATNKTLALDSSLVGKQIRVNAIYTDAFGSSENVFSPASNPIGTEQFTSLFSPTTTPSNPSATDGVGYELGMEFSSTTAGQVSAIRYYKAAGETGTHVGRIWSSTGTLLASVTFTNETASGWQEQALATPLNIQENTTYVVSVNANSHYAVTYDGLTSTISNGNLRAVADGSNGVFSYNYGSSTFPNQSFRNSNYYRDVVFVTGSAPPPNNNPGTVAINGTVREDQTLTAAVTDIDGLAGATIAYQWQQLEGGSWTNITGATNQTLLLGDSQSGKQVRVRASYTDALGSNETIFSSGTVAVVNVNDAGTVAISGTTTPGNTVTATVTDADGLGGATIGYQWEQFTNNSWASISGANNQTLVLDSSLVGRQIRVNAIYTDAFGTNENLFSSPSNPVGAEPYTMSVFNERVFPSRPNFSDGPEIDYELGMKFTSTTAGQISAIRYYKAASETGPHIGRIWSSTGTLLASVTFTNETASGWQQQALANPITIQANTTYVVSVNANSHYASTTGGLTSAIASENLTAASGGGVYNETTGAFPSQSFQNENYFRDVVFVPAAAPVSNKPGAIALNGTATENQTLSAAVTDGDGLSGVTIKYQWQQLENGKWLNITGETKQTLTLGDDQVSKRVRVRITYTDVLGNREYLISNATSPVVNVNELGAVIIRGSATTGQTLRASVIDDDGLTGVNINYQWQELVNNAWSNISGATNNTFALASSWLGKQLRVRATYTDTNSFAENIVSFGANIAAQNPIVIENQNQGTTAWKLTNLATNNEIVGYAGATSINQGEILPIKVSLDPSVIVANQPESRQYRIDVYRLGYYNGDGGRLMATSGTLSGFTQASPTIDQTTRLVETQWDTSYNLQVGNNWTSGLYLAKLTHINSGKESQLWFTVRDDDRPADLGFQAAFTTYEAYNNYGGYSTYTSNSIGGQRAYQVSFDRPFAETNNIERYNNMLTWEYNKARWLESQGYDVTYYTNLDVHTNPLQLYSQRTFLSVGHDEYWSTEMFDSIKKARDNGINLAFFSANTAYWRVRFEPSSSGQANRIMTIYKSNWYLDPVALADTSQATNVFRSIEVNRPENSLLGVLYTGDVKFPNSYNFVVSNATDPYYANTGLKNGDFFPGLVGYEWDSVAGNGLTPPGLVTLSRSPVAAGGILPTIPPGTDANFSNAVRYTAASGAKVFSTGTIQWSWGLSNFSPLSWFTTPNVVDSRIQQITVNVLADMGARPQTPSAGIVV